MKTHGDEDEVDAWDEHRREQLRFALKATPAQRLAWLEEAMHLARRRATPPTKSTTPRPR